MAELFYVPEIHNSGEFNCEVEKIKVSQVNSN